MKKLILLVTVSFLCMGLLSTYAADTPKHGKVVHIVAFKFKKAITEAKRKEIADGLLALKSKLPQIITIEHGPNASKEGFDKGFPHAFIVTFAYEKDRDGYLGHPEHKKFAKLLDGLLSDQVV